MTRASASGVGRRPRRRRGAEDLEALRAPVGREDGQRCPFADMPTAGSRPAPCRRSTPRLARRPRWSTVASPASTDASRSRNTQASAVCSRSNSLTWISPHARSPASGCGSSSRRARTAGRRSRAGGLERALRRGVGALDVGWWETPHRQRVDARVDDQGHARPTRPTPRRTRTGRRSGSSAARCGSDPAHERRAHEPRSLLATAHDSARPGSRPAAWSGCRSRARAWARGRCSERVGHAQLVAHVAAQLGHRVARLEVRQPGRVRM